MANIQKTIVTYSIEVNTKALIDEIGKQTKRSAGNVVDWAVSEAWERMQKAAQEKTTIEDAIKAGGE